MTRTIIDDQTAGAITTLDVLRNYGGHFARLMNAGGFRVHGIAGTANAITGRVDAQFFDSGLVLGQSVTWLQAATNPTDNVTIELTPYDDPVAGTGAGTPSTYPVLSATGDQVTSGELPAGGIITAAFEGGALRVVSGLDASGASTARAWIYETTQTWTRPVGRSDDELLFVIGWGGGGAGNHLAYSGGGGGGACAFGLFRLGDAPASVLASVGAGSSVAGANGGTSTFGALLTAVGGGGGGGSSSSPPVSGGVGGGFGANDGAFAGGAGGSVATTGASGSNAGAGAALGAGGGGAQNLSGQAGGGISMLGGNGGAGRISGAAEAGVAPGGGGGAARNGGTFGAGARGEWRVFLP